MELMPGDAKATLLLLARRFPYEVTKAIQGVAVKERAANSVDSPGQGPVDSYLSSTR